MEMLCCPVCREKLFLSVKSYRCRNNHCYDISKSGYVNLLLSGQMNAKLPGDNKMMVKARKSFLDKDYYKYMSDKLCNTVKAFSRNKFSIIDAGCGEGYYTNNVCNSLENVSCEILGIDISKNALELAAKRSKEFTNIRYAVGSLFHMPSPDSCCNILMTLFAPFCREEFYRVLADNGILIMVIPGENHLWGLKEAIYDTPYKNAVKDYNIDGFKLCDIIKCNDTIYIDNNEDIMNLFMMTPYFYKTSTEGSGKVDKLQNLETETDFEILIYKKL